MISLHSRKEEEEEEGLTVSSAQKQIVLLRSDVEHVAEGGGCLNHVSARGMENAFRFTGAAAGVEDEKRVFGGDPFHGAGGRGLSGGLVPPNVASGFELCARDFSPEPFED